MSYGYAGMRPWPDELPELPEPPDNPDFLELPESFQNQVADRFERGARLTRELNQAANEEWRRTVRDMHARRNAAQKVKVERATKARKARRANKASLGELGLREALRRKT